MIMMLMKMIKKILMCDIVGDIVKMMIVAHLGDIMMMMMAAEHL